MKRKRYSAEQIVYGLRQVESGSAVVEICGNPVIVRFCGNVSGDGSGSFGNEAINQATGRGFKEIDLRFGKLYGIQHTPARNNKNGHSLANWICLTTSLTSTLVVLDKCQFPLFAGGTA